ncbi:MAG: lysylphosphatidylglycerol synthase domain-containing protein, partial [Candidatus Binatia bacterium]
MRRLQLALLLLGIGLFFVVLQKVGFATVAKGLLVLGWTFPLILAVEFLIDALHTEGWRHCLPTTARTRVPRLDLLLVRTAGVGVNVLTPTATVGGEVVKGMLLKRWIELGDGYASVMIDKLTFALGQTGFLLVGLGAVLQVVPFSPRERILSIVAAGLWLAGVAGFFILQRRGIFRFGVGALRAVFGGSGIFERLPEHAADFDDRITRFLATHHRDLVASAGWHFVGQAARTLQFYLALHALGFEPSLETCLTAASGLVFMEATLFLIPGKVGVLEGGYVLV